MPTLSWIFVLAMLAFPAPRAAAQSTVPDCRVDVGIALAPSLTLDVDYACHATETMSFAPAIAETQPFLRDVRDRNDVPVEMAAGTWDPPVEGGVARLRYRIDLGALARRVDSVPVAIARGDAVMAVLGAWLLQPRRGTVDRPLVIDIVPRPTGPDLDFVAGLPLAGSAWRLAGTTVSYAGYTTIGTFASKALPVSAPGSLASGDPRQIAAAPVRLAILPGSLAVPHDDLVRWVAHTAQAEANFWDGFPAPGLLITLIPKPGLARVGYGRVVPGGGASMALEIGAATERAALYDDWVLVHELIHTAMPFITGGSTFLMEGAATLLEPIIRARAGWKSEADVWREWVTNMPRGAGGVASGKAIQGSPYWSGALFLLLADVEARRATGGRLGIEDCLRAQLRGGPQASLRLSRESWVALCDAEFGRPIVAPLLVRLVERGEPVDLAALWRDLGVGLQQGKIVYDDTAPLAAIRRTIVNGHEARPQQRVSPND